MIARRSFLPWLAALLAMGISGTAMHALYSAEKENIQQAQRLETVQRLSTIRARLEGTLNGLLSLSRGIAAVMATRPDVDHETLSRLAAELMPAHPAVRNLATSRGYVVDFVYPRHGNEAVLGVNYLDVPDQREAVARAVDSHQGVLAGPVPLIQGGRALVARTPVFATRAEGALEPGPFVGLVSIPIDIDTVFREAGLTAPDLPIKVALRGRDGLGRFGEVFHGDAQLFDGRATVMDVTLPGGRWQMAGMPAAAPTSRSLDALSSLGGLVALMSGLLGFAAMRHILEQGAARERFYRILAQAPFGVALVRAADGAIAFINRRGWEALDAQGPSSNDTITRYMAKDDWERVRDAATAGGVVHDAQLRLSTVKGREMWALLSVAAVEVDKQATLCLAFGDATHVKEVEAELNRTIDELARSNTELERFAYVASHDLQEPLRTVTSYAQLLERRYGAKLDADAADFLAFIVEGARRMHNLVNDLLAYSRIDAQSRPFAVVDCSEVLGVVLGNLRDSIADSGARVNVAPLPSVRGDMMQLMQLFQNLIGNAVKFRAPGRPPQVEIGAERQGDAWLFSVKDNGIGIEPQYLDSIFAIFRRLHRGDAYPGTGIGLSICKRVVERHGGELWVESEAGQGTTFFFRLAAAEAELQAV